MIRIISEYLSSHGKPIRIYSIVSEDGTVKAKTFKTIEIAADSQTITAKDTYTLEDIEEALEECKESLEVKEQKDILQAEATETDIQSCEDINKDSEDFQPIFKSS